MTEESEARYRLPRTVVPSRYDLVVEPDLDSGKFAGTVDISVRVVEPVSEIVLNAAGLALEGARLIDAGGRAIGVERIRIDGEAERACLYLAEAARPGDHTLHIEFAGSINDELRGFYRSTYSDGGEQRTIASTHFEATDARRAFPCWDEPDLKAVFGVTLVVRDGLLAVSGGPEAGREPLGDGRVRIRFADTMRQSTYLVAYVVGPLEATGPVDADGVPLRVIAAPGKAQLAGYALECGAFFMQWFREYYGIPYPDAKMDFVALPDFAMGAMENTGCITFREWLLLVDPDDATQQEMLNVAETIAHELAHQWFGNLVTMRWWNGIWLNEAFATFMAVLAIDAFRPDWHRWDSFQRSRSSAFETDALESTRPIEYPVRSPEDANGMFDVLTYTKGGAILRMLERYLGTDAFRGGIRAYLAAHAFGNTETHDLWDAIEGATGEPVPRIMDSFIWQGGYPLLTAALDDGSLVLSQRRFRFEPAQDGARWSVPLFVRSQGGERPILLEGDVSKVAIEDGGGPVVVNAGGASFVRVRYERPLGDRLVAALGELAVAERYGVVDDLWATVLAGEALPSEFLGFVGAFAGEDDPSVWQTIVSGLGWCDRFVEGETRERLRAYVRELCGPGLARLGWEPVDGEADLTRSLRGTLISALGVLGRDPKVAAASREREAKATAGDGIDPAVVAASVGVVAAHGTAEDYERFIEAYRAARTPQEQLRYLGALAGFGDAALMDRTLELAFSNDVRVQDAPFLLSLSIANRDNGPRAWGFAKTRWADAASRFPFNLLVRIADGVRFLTRPQEQADASAFFASHPLPQNARTLAQILERQRVGVRLRERAEPDLKGYFT